MKSSLIILTLNEIEGVRTLYDRIPFDAVDECFVVDGGSIDGTVEFFRERGIKVVPQEIKGRGEAFRIAVKEAKGSYLIFFSPDGNENPGDIPKLLELLARGYDIAIASRFLSGSQNEEDDLRFPWRAWANRTFTYIANIIWNTNRNYITDTINGYRAVKKGAFNKLNINAPGFVIEYQMSIRAMKLGLKVVEIPTIEGQRIGGVSTAKSISTGLLFLRFLFKEIKNGRKF
ncbi:MAG: glycosyltransferase [Candidatus Scalindua rubra]|uniref:Glycosyltransferase n=1 Tax=Candidatus Scalindua rubra TaxID=1872076 RepID=A0A1E3XGG9_9BACT|nr:MAG: glycosyltransferase [Candidatus Scalindua rubra]